MPVVRKDTKYKSEEEYLNTYFRLLREECFYKLRKGINDFVKSGQKCDSKEMTVYRELEKLHVSTYFVPRNYMLA